MPIPTPQNGPLVVILLLIAATLLIALVVVALHFRTYQRRSKREIEHLRAERERLTESLCLAKAEARRGAAEPIQAEAGRGGAEEEQTEMGQAEVEQIELGRVPYPTHKEHRRHSAVAKRGAERDREFLAQIEEIAERQIANPHFSVNDLARAAYMSRSVLFARIKSLTGTTPNNYFKTLRLRRAATLLREGQHKIGEICDLVGFNTPSYFAKCFCEHYGVMPREYAARAARQKGE